MRMKKRYAVANWIFRKLRTEKLYELLNVNFEKV